MPKEAVILQLCEMFHCRPSELESEDGLLLLHLVDIKRWRDVALQYDNDPSSKAVTNEDKHRLLFLSMGKTDALRVDISELNHDALSAVDPKKAWSYTQAKKEEIKSEAVLLNQVKNGKDI